MLDKRFFMRTAYTPTLVIGAWLGWSPWLWLAGGVTALLDVAENIRQRLADKLLASYRTDFVRMVRVRESEDEAW